MSAEWAIMLGALGVVVGLVGWTIWSTIKEERQMNTYIAALNRMHYQWPQEDVECPDIFPEEWTQRRQCSND